MVWVGLGKLTSNGEIWERRNDKDDDKSDRNDDLGGKQNSKRTKRSCSILIQRIVSARTAH